jgi:hypothetical protein
MDEGQPPPKHILGKGRALVCANALAQSQSSSPYITVCESFRDIGLDRSQPWGPQSASTGDLGRIASRADYDGRQIMNMRDDRTLQIRSAQCLLVFENSEIPDQQPHDAGIAW